jgi:hypothetical protein
VPSAPEGPVGAARSRLPPTSPLGLSRAAVEAPAEPAADRLRTTSTEDATWNPKADDG